ncbi:MAG: D-alanyl-D-alanine carboxypeptidase/D-alanyl-D-alanine-endopeptidase [Deltaproteobacteria bacterium]
MRWVPIIVLSTVVSGATAGAPGTAWADDPSEKRLVAELEEILRAPELENAFAGVHIRSIKNDRVLFDHNGGKLFNPASNMKILTTATALWYLGPTYRFRTEARRDRSLDNGVLHGNLYIKGYGDPTLTTEEMFGFVNQIALRGIKKITGHVIIDPTFFDDVSEGPGWDQEIGDHAYAAPIGALSANFNTFEVRILPGDRIGAPVKAEVWPPVPGLEAVVSAYTRGRGARSRIWTGTTRVGDGVRVTVRGSLPTNYYEGLVVRKRVHNPTTYAGWLVHHLLEMRGIDVRGRVKIGVMPTRGTLPVATHWSRPLAEIVSTLNKYSNNFMAEQILKTVGAELSEPPGTWNKGNQAIRDFLVELGVEDETFVLANGSGLNDVNRVTPQQIGQVLEAMYERFDLRPEFVSSLAVAGRSGTINGRFENSPAQLRLRAKTGSLTGVSALSGYVTTPTNDVLVFSVMMNDYAGRARTMWRIQDRIGIALARFRSSNAVAASKTEPAAGVQ